MMRILTGCITCSWSVSIASVFHVHTQFGNSTYESYILQIHSPVGTRPFQNPPRWFLSLHVIKVAIRVSNYHFLFSKYCTVPSMCARYGVFMGSESDVSLVFVVRVRYVLSCHKKHRHPYTDFQPNRILLHHFAECRYRNIKKSIHFCTFLHCFFKGLIWQGFIFVNSESKRLKYACIKWMGDSNNILRKLNIQSKFT